MNCVKDHWVLLFILLLLGNTNCFAVTESDKLERLFSDYVEQVSKFEPLWTKINDEAGLVEPLQFEYSAHWRSQRLALERKFLKQLNAIPMASLSKIERLNAQIFAYQRRLMIKSFNYPEHLLPTGSIVNLIRTFPLLGSGQGAQGFSSIKDYENWYQIMESLPAYVDGIMANLEQGIKEGVVYPKQIVQVFIDELNRFQVELVENSVYYRPVTEMPGFFIPNQKQYVILRYSKLIKEKILPSYGKLAGFLERDYLPFTAASVSLARFKQGADWYQYLVEQQGAQISAKELHQQALALLVQLRLEIDEIKQQMDFKGGVAELFEFLDNSPTMQYQNPTQVLEHFRKLSHQVNLAMPQLFSSFPRSTYQVKLANRNEQRKERVFYQLADYNKALPGVFWVNAEQITEHRVWRSESLFLQYGVPGAFYLAAIEQEVKRQPEFRKGWNQVAFREGWSLYAMSLGSQLGLYKEPLSKLGKIRVELEKIALMAADTGIHALGWEPLQAESFLQNNLFISQQRAAALVQFIALYPGRSIAPGVGLNTFRSLRQWGESSKPEQFDIRQFHALLIEQGAMPLPVLEHWVKEQLKHNR